MTVDGIYRARAEGWSHNRWPTPQHLARALDSRTVTTPALELIAAQLADAADSPDGRLIVSIPPKAKAGCAPAACRCGA